MLTIAKSITIRALNPGMAILDGENARRPVKISGGTVVLEGLAITKGSIDWSWNSASAEGYTSEGGGLRIGGGDVTLNNCDIHHNQVLALLNVSARLLSFP